MAKSRHANRPDGNHAEIRAALRAAGWVVVDTTIMRGKMPDMIASKAGVTVVVEAKLPGKALTECEEKFFSTWHGAKIIAYGGQDAVDKCQAVLLKAGKV